MFVYTIFEGWATVLHVVLHVVMKVIFICSKIILLKNLMFRDYLLPDVPQITLMPRKVLCHIFWKSHKIRKKSPICFWCFHHFLISSSDSFSNLVYLIVSSKCATCFDLLICVWESKYTKNDKLSIYFYRKKQRKKREKSWNRQDCETIWWADHLTSKNHGRFL